LKSSPFSEPLPADIADAVAEARPRLGVIGSSLLFYSTTGSTNDVAASLASLTPGADREGAVVLAEAQTAGRGRLGRVWFSPVGSGLYVSVVLAPARSVDRRRATGLLTLAAGVALVEAVRTATGLVANLKWPNDLQIGRRKLAGILAEAVTVSPRADIDFVVLGYGVNIRRQAYPPELGDRATSLEVELGRPIDRAALFVETLAAIARRYHDLVTGRFDAILDAWRTHAPSATGARISWQVAGEPRTGISAGIDQEGALLARVGDRTERIVAGEVTWL
jgi:BirA family biotin operon repressor/biotin-[acetyl-CoA-carboxylase] ligase